VSPHSSTKAFIGCLLSCNRSVLHLILYKMIFTCIGSFVLNIPWLCPSQKYYSIVIKSLVLGARLPGFKTLSFCVCLWNWSLNSGPQTCKADTLSLEPHFQSILFWFFWRWGISWAICPNWSWTEILQISASQIARITGASHQRPELKSCAYYVTYS
jgi:hypothetical protein